MKHKFIPSMLDSSTCIQCKKIEVMHGPEAICESCDTTGEVEIVFGDMALCSNCIERDIAVTAETERTAEARVIEYKSEMERRLDIVKAVDSALQVKSDLFNAKTAAILELKELIYADDTVENKPYKLAEVLTERFLKFKSLIFDMQQDIIDKSNEQKAIQVYLNNLANSLRAEERESLKLQDINYTPKVIKTTIPKVVKVKSTAKLDKAELNKYAAELGVGAYMLQMLVTAKGISLEQAANQIRKSIAEAKSE